VIDAAWTALETAAQKDQGVRIESLFAAEPDRLSRLTLDAAGLFLDFSKQPWSRASLAAGLDLARAAHVEDARARMFAGDIINASEGRAVLHPALRGPDDAAFPVMDQVRDSRAALRAFAEGVASGAIAASDGAPFTAILHIGIGGSDLGPRLVWDALRPLKPAIDLVFAANVDPHEIAMATGRLDPARTLVVVVSKTFTTQETMANAETARAWLRAALGDGANAHLAAVSTNLAATRSFGVADDRVFGFWDWVGGRFSVWSAVGLSCAVALGWETFEAFLAGAAAMDQHFVDAPLEANAPVLLALANIYNRNGLGRGARAVAPYAQGLALLPAFLQQLEMESNGKPAARSTAGVVFGEPGTNGQHAFFQLLHQGSDVIPVEFIVAARAMQGPAEQQTLLLANCLAQAEALMTGADYPEPHRKFPGDRPSTMIVLERLDAAALGALIALYEHKTFVEGVIWRINSFDQWGVELGKTLAARILDELRGGERLAHDPSTKALVARFAR